MLLTGSAPQLIVSFADPANLANVASGTQMSLEVEVNQLGPVASQSAITGNISVEWWNGSAIDGQTKEGGAPIGTASAVANTSLPSGTQSDATVAVTLNKSDAQSAGPLTDGGYLLVALYDGGGSYPATGSSDAIMVTFSGSTVTSSNNSLAFVQNPSNAVVGQTIAPAVTVAIKNPAGNIDTASHDTITLAIAGGIGTLSGTDTQIAVAGVATFSDLSIADLGTYTLIATSGTDISATSNSFNITAGELVFLNQPQDGVAGDALSPAVTVALEDGSGNVATSNSTTSVELDLVGSTNPITGNIATLVNGVATFSNVVFSEPGQYQLQASDGTDTAATSNAFNVTVTSDHLVFIQQPVNTDLNVPITLSVELENASNQIDTAATTSIQLSLNTLSGGVGAALAGNLTVPFVGGIASFTATAGVAVNVLGTYSLVATEVQADVNGIYSPTDSTAAITSNPFAASPYQLVMIKQPAKSADVNVPIVFTVAIETAKHKIDKVEDSAVVQVALNTITGGVGATLQGTTSLMFVSGVAKFIATGALSIDIPGTYSLSLSEPDLSASISTKSFKINGLHLAVRKLSRTMDLYTNIPFAVALLNSRNMVVKTQSTASVQVNFETISGGANAVLSGITTATFVKGIATFTAAAGPSFNSAGTYSLMLSDTDATGSPSLATTSVTSHTFKVLADHIAIERQPGGSVAPEKPFPLKLALEDSRNKINTAAPGYVANLMLNTLSDGIGEVFSGTTSLDFTNGVADFTDLQLSDTPGVFSFSIDALSSIANAAVIPSITSRTFKVTQPLHVHS